MRRRPVGKIRFRRGASLPSVLTSVNLFFGLLSLVKSIQGQYEFAALFIAASIFLDGMDGLVARLTGTSSDFGRELDSLSDLISFGVAPAILVYCWALSALGRPGMVVTFGFVLCGALRLARFNIQAFTTDKRYFIGLPIPAAAGALAALVFFYPHPVQDRVMGVLVWVLLATLAVLMVARLRYRSLKGLDLRARRPYQVLLTPILILLAIFAWPQQVLLAMAFLYVLSGVLPRRFLAGRAESREGTGPVPAPQSHGPE
ncbi:MAG TPA: CDP-diacylglycerol--serine O-phosphatidyltransferase [Candidatus Polarisedimenticolia bacterium]|nr:CDP-diacylglycerol--serine O-phosphatidyltransferase [Candidatus Polarisedimenticolia bacterium]